MKWLGLDIGGANLKAADGAGWARSVMFPLWRDPAGLAAAVEALVASAPAAEGLAVTMTGELCDCFANKAEGVLHILNAVQRAAGRRDVRVYLLDGKLATHDEARAAPHLAAASNWHALATLAGRLGGKGAGLLIDIGSTTTDIVPLLGGNPHPGGLTDTERLIAHELVYTGVGRTPICAIARALPWRGRRCPVAAELFATAADAYVVLGQLPEQPDAVWTADGRPLTREFSRARLARMLCADPAEFTWEDAGDSAREIRARQIGHIGQAVRTVVGAMDGAPEWLVLGGAGEFLGREIARKEVPGARLDCLSDRLGQAVSVAAPAHALAVLAREIA